MTNKKIVIIGAGLAGLVSGYYGQLNGYQTEIFDQQSVVGGMIQNWNRKGYTIEATMHHLAGLKLEDSTLEAGKIFKTVGAFEKKDCYIYKNFHKVDDPFKTLDSSKQQSFCLPTTDINSMKHYLQKFAKTKNDIRLVKDYLKMIKLFTDEQFLSTMFSNENNKYKDINEFGERIGFLQKIQNKIKNFKNFKYFLSKMKITSGQFGQKFNNPILRKAIPLMHYNNPLGPLAIQGLFIGGVVSKDWGYILKGSQNFTNNVAENYKNKGGKIHLNSKVKKIILDEKNYKKPKAKGIQLSNGEIIDADIVISACDYHQTVYDFIDPKYEVNKTIDKYYENMPDNAGQIQISIGLNRVLDINEYPFLYTWLLKDSKTEIAKQGKSTELDDFFSLKKKKKNKNYCYGNAPIVIDRMHIHNFSFDKSLAPENKSVISIMLDGLSVNYWSDLRKSNKKRYNVEKKHIEEKCIEILEERFPGIKKDIEMIDTITNATWEHYCGVFCGMMPWGKPSSNFLKALFGKDKYDVDSIKDLYLSGQWVRGMCGFSTAAETGFNSIKKICEDDKKKFIESE